MACGHIHRHCGASRNPVRAAIFTVIPAQAGIYGVWSDSPSFRRKPESMACGHNNRHSGASRNLWRAVRSTVIAAQAGIQCVRLDPPSFRRKPESMACGHMHRHCGASRNPGRVVICTIIPASPAVIPAQAGIYAPRWTPVSAGMTGPYLNHLKRNIAPAVGG